MTFFYISISRGRGRFASPPPWTRAWLFIDIRATLVINIITLRPLFISTIFFLYIIFLYHSFIVNLSFPHYCQICYNLICCTIFNQNLIHVMLQIAPEFFLGGHVVSTSICFYMVSLAQPI